MIPGDIAVRTGRAILTLVAGTGLMLQGLPAQAQTVSFTQILNEIAALASNQSSTLQAQQSALLAELSAQAGAAEAAANALQTSGQQLLIGASMTLVFSMAAATVSMFGGATSASGAGDQSEQEAMSCPVFVGAGTLLGEDSCIWTKGAKQWTNQFSTNNDIATWRVGGQTALAPDWFVGGTIAASTGWTSATGGVGGRTQAADASMVLKHVAGPWLLAGGLGFASNWAHMTRPAGLSGIVLQSDANAYRIGGTLRAAYEFAFDAWYARPRFDFGVSYITSPGFQEAGQSVFALSVYGLNKVLVALKPALELGGRFAIGETMTLRPYVVGGAVFLPNNDWTINASFVGPLSSFGTFGMTLYGPTVIGIVEAGLQLYEAHGTDVRAEYKLGAGDNYLSQTASLRLAYHF